MKERPMTDALIRDFLLGKVDDEVRQEIESGFITDSEAHERILAAEQDLIDDYLENTLTQADKEFFLSNYAGTADQKRRLRISKTIKDWANGETTEDVAVTSRWNKFRHQISLRPFVVIPVAATLLVAITLFVVLLNQRAQEKNSLLALEQEIARLNSPSTLHAAPRSPDLILAPISVRGVENKNELAVGSDSSIVELRLVWLQKEDYPTYRAVVQQVGNEKSLVVSNLLGESDSGTKIRLRLPARALPHGLYQIRLAGVDAAGVTGPEEEYTFNVRR